MRGTACFTVMEIFMDTAADLLIEVIYFFLIYLNPQCGDKNKTLSQKMDLLDGFVKVESTSHISFIVMEGFLFTFNTFATITTMFDAIHIILFYPWNT